MSKFKIFVYTPAGYNNASLAITASRAGAVGILNAELTTNPHLILNQLNFLSRKAIGEYGIKLSTAEDRVLSAIVNYAQKGLRWVIFDGEFVKSSQEWISKLKQYDINVLAELKTIESPEIRLDDVVDGLVLKGNESGGFVGESSCFILLQKWLNQTKLPLFLRGGVTPYVAAASSAVGAAGGVIDSQILLLEESPLAKDLFSVLDHLSGNETIAVGNDEKGEFFRVLVRPGYRSATEFYAAGEGKNLQALKALVQDKINWRDPVNGLLPLGQDVCFASQWRNQYGHMAAVIRAIESTVSTNLRQAVKSKPFSENAPLAQSLGVDLPIVQGPMTRVSDNSKFAAAVSQGGALPTIALSLLNGEALDQLFKETTDALDGAPWGIGLLGFAPHALFDEQLAAAKKYKPSFAIIAGGRPDQAIKFEKAAIQPFLHVPSANLLPLFLQEGARHFIFEGRECGGHVGPLSSFVLWSIMVDRLLSELNQGNYAAEDIHVLFAGGIHDAASSAMVQVLAAPLVKAKVKIGVLMGSSYLFVREMVTTGALLSTFQKEALDCERTVCLQSGPGHASRCAYTPFAKTFFHQRQELQEKKIPAVEIREALDKLILGRLRLASRGFARNDKDSELKEFDESYQKLEGMYMLGQVATLRKDQTDIPSLHREVTEDANNLLIEHIGKATQPKTHSENRPVDIAIVGIASWLPKANSTQDYWENILNKVVATTEIPSHRWDWKIYYDKDRHAKDKVYSKWGGFVDDMAFDPTRYGIPPKSIESVDPMQLMALEIAHRALADAGYDQRDFDREHTAVIIGASGGVGDVGLQYGLRTELPRFQGFLPESVAERLPSWTEDTFAGILPNVIAGRIANRLNLGGVNFTTDAACASSLAAIYQAISELSAERSNFAIAGGVDTVQGPFGYMCFSKTQALSPQGRCRTFDSSADGIVISEGIAMIALKRLKDAERDGDRIYAVIKGVGGSSDGRAKGLSAPEPAGQLRAMRRAYDKAGFSPNTVGLFEAHGTGTVIGDTAELESTTQLVRKAGGKSHQAAVSSVKTLIGHTKATAGVAGLIKTALALHHRVIPPHFPVLQPIEVLQQNDSPLYLPEDASPWLTENGHPRRAAVSAFGFGGTNFHVVLEEYTGEYRPWLRPAVSQHWPAELLLWCGHDRKDLTAKLVHIQHELEGADNIELRDLAFNLAKKWQPGKETIAIVATDPNELKNKISSTLEYLEGKKPKLPPGLYHSNSAALDGKVAVLFPGQGSQYPAMFRELAIHFPVLSETLSEADTLLSDCFAERFGEKARLNRFIFPRGAYSKQAKADAMAALTRTDVAQPAIGAVSAGLWRLMRNLGLAPKMLGGHSYGEFIALFASGHIDFQTLISLSEARGRFIVDAVKTSGDELGKMAAVQAPREVVERMIADIDNLLVANHNAPQQSIISGSTTAIQEAVLSFTNKGINAREIPVAAAFHSPFVAPAQTALSDLIFRTTWQENGGGIPVYSNTTGTPHTKDTQQIKQVMTDHLVKPIEFVAQIEAMYHDGARVFLELGPKTVLTNLVKSILGEERPHKAIAIDGNGGGIADMLKAIGQLLCAGVKMDVIKLFEGRMCLEGDTAEIKQMRCGAAVAKHAWMLNGSGARRVGEPVKQIGVCMDTLQTLSEATTQKREVQQFIPQPNSTVTNKAMPINRRKETPIMKRHGQAPRNRDASVIAEYFETMRVFLESQERVISAYLGGVPANRRSAERPQTIRHSRLRHDYTDPVADHALNEPVSPSQQDYPATTVEKPDVSHQDPPAYGRQNEIASTEETQSATGASESLQAEESGQSSELQNITDILLSIVEDKTGYPKDMVGLDQNLEADLGIDSIKRVEIVGALMKALPQNISQSIDGERGKLNTQTTLKGMVDMLAELEKGISEAHPFKRAGVGSRTLQPRHSLRHVIEPKRVSIDESAMNRLEKGHFILTPDRLGVAQKIAELLRARDCAVHIVAQDLLEDENSLAQWCATLREEVEIISGVVHLAQIGSDIIQEDSSPDKWYHQLQLNEKSLFILLHNLSDLLKAEAHILSASALGGFFNRQTDKVLGLSLQGGAVGLLKSLYQERQGLRVKAVDVDPGQKPDSIAIDLLREIEVVGGRQEVGYPDGKRTIFQTVPVPVEADETQMEKMGNLVVLVTGGAKGVTAEVIREFALPGNTLLLTGRSALLDSEPEHLKSFTTSESLRQHFVSEVRKGRLKMSPAKIRKEIRSILSAREMLSNIDDFRQRGSTVEYFSIDVTDHDAMQRLLENIYKQYGRVDGVIHGAGVIEDKLLADKNSDSWSRVVETKVIGLLSLQKCLRPESLKFFTVFSSVAGRYGNSGQTDYATANELMNRLCCQLQCLWGNKVKVKSLCWGPWGPTKFGKGMVNEFTEAKFAEKGVILVSAEGGRNLFKAELYQDNGKVEIICGEGPWEKQEAEIGRIENRPSSVNTSLNRPLLHNATFTSPTKGDQFIALSLGDTHAYLRDHCIDNIPVLPAAVALEIMAEGASQLWPDWVVTEVRDCRLLKGVKLEASNQKFQLSVKSPAYGTSDGFEVNAVIQSVQDNGQQHFHYRSVLRLEQQLPAQLKHKPPLFDEKELSVTKAYNELLFHGPRFQVIEEINGLADNGANALVRQTCPSQWLENIETGDDQWVFDPAVIDAAAQMAILWSRIFRDETALPVGFGRVVRFSETLPDKVHMHFERLPGEDSHTVHANVHYTNADNQVVLLIEDMQCISSAALNRVGGTAKMTFEDAASSLSAKEA